VGALQYELARRLIIDLSRHRVELESRGEAGDRAEVERQEVEEERAVRLRRERHHLAFPLLGNMAVDVVQVRRLARASRAIVDDLARDLAGLVVDERHQALPNSAARLRFRSRSKFSFSMGSGASGGGGAAFARFARNSSKYIRTSPRELSSSKTVRKMYVPRGVCTSARK